MTMKIPVPQSIDYHYSWRTGEGPKIHDQLADRAVVVTRVKITSFSDEPPTIGVQGLKLTVGGKVDKRQQYDLPVYDPDFEAAFLAGWQAQVDGLAFQTAEELPRCVGTDDYGCRCKGVHGHDGEHWA